jgi:RNA polymerase sigma-70 factor (ECF subfamily)
MSTGAPSHSEEAGWLARIAHGDESAFVQFYRRYSGPVFAMLFKMLGNQHDAEEVLQSSFLQIWQKAATFDATRSAPFTWLVMIARHRALDRLRARQRQVRLEESAAQEPEPFSAAPDGVPGLQGDTRSLLEGALVQIPGEQRRAIEMAFFHGLTHDEISVQLGEPLGTIKARIRRGMLRLRDLVLHRA